MRHTSAILSVSALYYTNDGSATNEEHFSDEGAWTYNSHVGQNDGRGWALCDKDCGWCGHCADNVGY
jgi:hypothetical protein